MIQKRNVALYVVLSFVTCGIWVFVWYVLLADDIGKIRGDGKPNGPVEVLLIFVTCGIWAIVLGYTWPDKLNEGLRERGLPTNDNLPTLGLVLNIFGLGIITLVLMQSESNKVAQADQA